MVGLPEQGVDIAARLGHNALNKGACQQTAVLGGGRWAVFLLQLFSLFKFLVFANLS